MTDLSTFKPRNYRINNVTLNWAKLGTPVIPFGVPQYELQIETTDKTIADELKANHFNVKENAVNKSFTVSLKRKALRQDGSDNGKPTVFDAAALPVADVTKIGNGSIGNVVVYQMYYKNAGREGISNSLTSIQIVDLKEYSGSTMFEPIVNIDTPSTKSDELPLDNLASNPF
jgi:hypothetical protein|tara:strand:- start:512 stop:1030 length:519 start_codon:yes stop_codon:yes gene_type:complete